MIKCKRCRRELHTDVWGKWVTRELWRTCQGDREHEPVRPA